MRFVNELITVEANFAAPDAPTPTAFWWQGQRYQIAGRGRTWRDEDGVHYLVMTPAQETFELNFVLAEARWYLRRKFANGQMGKSANSQMC